MAKKKRSPERRVQTRFPRLRFDCAGETLSTATVSHFRDILNLTDDHQKLLRKSNGGTPDATYFKWSTSDGTHESHLDCFLGIDNQPFGPARRTDIISVILTCRDYLPPSTIPFALVDHEDLLLTYTDGEREGQVWLLVKSYPLANEEYDPSHHVFFVANSLAEFLNSLYTSNDPYSPVAIALDTPKVRGKQLATKLGKLGCRPFRFKGVTSQTALPPTWEWPKFQRADEDLPAVLSVEKNHTYGYSPQCDQRAKGHKILVVNVTKSSRKKCIQELLTMIGENGEVVDA